MKPEERKSLKGKSDSDLYGANVDLVQVLVSVTQELIWRCNDLLYVRDS